MSLPTVLAFYRRVGGVSSPPSLGNQSRSLITRSIEPTLHTTPTPAAPIGPSTFPKPSLDPSIHHPQVNGLSPSTRSLFFLYYLLSPTTTPVLLASRYPLPLTASSILSLYTYSEELGNTIPLGPDELSTLIHICGSLASQPLLPPPPADNPIHPFVDPASIKLDVSNEELGRFISKLLEAKTRQKEPITESDRYWYLRTCVAWLQTTHPSGAKVAASLASRQYLALSHCSDFEIHQLAILALPHMNNAQLTSVACRHFCEVIEDLSLDGVVLLELARRCITAAGGEVWVGRIAQMWRQRMLASDVMTRLVPEETVAFPLSMKSLAAMFKSALSGSLDGSFPNVPQSLAGWIYTEVLHAITLPASSSSGCQHAFTVARNFKSLTLPPIDDMPKTSLELGSSPLSAWEILVELNTLEENSRYLELQPSDILELHDRWTQFSRQDSVPPAVERAVTLSFVRLAGKYGDARLLGRLATSVVTAQLQHTDTLASTNPVLVGSHSNPLHHQEDSSCLAIEWAIAEASVSRVQWDTLLQSLRNVKLLRRRNPHPAALSTFASILIHRLAENHLDQAFDLFKATSTMDLLIPREITRSLCDTAIRQKSFDIAIELMESSLRPTESGTAASYNDEEAIALLGDIVKAMSRAGVVSLSEDTAKRWSRLLSLFFPKFAISVSTNPDLRHWEWQLLVLARSRQYQSVADIFSSITKCLHLLSEETIHTVVHSLSNSQQHRLAMIVRESVAANISRQPPSRAFRFSPLSTPSNLLLDLDRFIYRSVAKAGMHSLVEEMWAKLVDGRKFADGTAYSPDHYERILRHYGKRKEWLQGGDVPQSLFKGNRDPDDRTVHLRAKSMAIAERKKAGEKIILNKLLRTNDGDQSVTIDGRPAKRKAIPSRKDPTPSTLEREASSATVALNVLLNAALTAPRHEAHSRVQTVRLVFSKFQQLVLDRDQGLQTIRPDRITFNTLIKGLLNIPALSPAAIRWLFDVLVQCGYPTGSLRRTGQPGKGHVFGTPQHFQDASELLTSLDGSPPREPTSSSSTKASPPFSADVELLKRRSVVLEAAHSIHHQPILFRQHTEPLYRMFIKAFYRRADVRSARRVLYVYKSVKDTYHLGVEREQSKQWVASIGRGEEQK